tara:strand:+ start:2237 stop:2812 length:576 start_codon:yes stop_codon:yes gene_type:complete
MNGSNNGENKSDDEPTEINRLGPIRPEMTQTVADVRLQPISRRSRKRPTCKPTRKRTAGRRKKRKKRTRKKKKKRTRRRKRKKSKKTKRRRKKGGGINLCSMMPDIASPDRDRSHRKIIESKSRKRGITIPRDPDGKSMWKSNAWAESVLYCQEYPNDDNYTCDVFTGQCKKTNNENQKKAINRTLKSFGY